MDATPPTSVAGAPLGAPSSENCTFPVGVVAGAVVLVTVAVSLADVRYVGGVAGTPTAVLVASAATAVVGTRSSAPTASGAITTRATDMIRPPGRTTESRRRRYRRT